MVLKYDVEKLGELIKSADRETEIVPFFSNKIKAI